MSVEAIPVREEERAHALYAHGRAPKPKARFGPRRCVLSAEYSAHAIKAMEVRDDDVWIVTYPRSGTTWTQEMVWLLMHDLDFEGAKAKTLFDRSPFLEFSRFAGFVKDETFTGNVDTVERTEQLPSPRCIKSHLPKVLLPDELWTKKPKIVYVAREPKDSAVSYYYHHKLVLLCDIDKDFFFECLLADDVLYGPLWEHIRDFWLMRDQPNILFNTYEEMKEDLPAVIQRTARFLGKTLTEDQVNRLADHLDFQRMRENPAVNNVSRLQDARKFIRSGTVGEGQREMKPETAATFDERTRKTFGDSCPWKI